MKLNWIIEKCWSLTKEHWTGLIYQKKTRDAENGSTKALMIGGILCRVKFLVKNIVRCDECDYCKCTRLWCKSCYAKSANIMGYD
jgi:hypothetical protein